jgi:hypothetical protein
MKELNKRMKREIENKWRMFDRIGDGIMWKRR